jgi:DNA-binding response OmpR family regulator
MRLKIILADNNPMIRELLENFLVQEGHEVRTACDYSGASHACQGY